jgi:hypothetical protein
MVKKPQSQASLADQIAELEDLAVLAGLYDAHDFLIQLRSKTKKSK